MTRGQKILIAIGVVLGLTILIPVVRHYQLRFAVEKYIAELKAKGEPMDLARVIPSPVPPDKNSADIFRSAANLFESDQTFLKTNYVSSMRSIAPGKAMVCSRQPNIRNADFLTPNGTNSWEEVMAAVSQNRESFELLRQLIEKPKFDFQIKYESGIADLSFTNFHLAESKKAALRLSGAVICDLHQNDAASAVTNLNAILALVNAMHDERLVISELVRMAIANIAISASWETLQSPNLSETELVDLQKSWADLEFIEAGENALVMERGTGEISLNKWRDSSSELYRYLDIGRKARESMGSADSHGVFYRPKMATQIFLWRYWWSYPDELRALKGYEVLVNTMRSAKTNSDFQSMLQDQEAQLNKLGISALTNDIDMIFTGQIDFHSIVSESLFALDWVATKVMRIEAAKNVVVTAIALKRYQIKYGHCPTALDVLVPEFLSTVPLDPVDGKPLRYQPNADGTYLLYSVGENGKDDGGDPSLEKGVNGSTYWQSPHALDWVWPQPATPDEIRNYYAHPPR